MPILGPLLALLQAARAPRPGPDEARPVESPVVVPAPEPSLGIAQVGAWVGLSGFSTAKARAGTIAAARALGLRRLDLIVNDFSAEREEQAFRAYTMEDLVAMAALCHDAGIAVHLMSWVMPHARFIDTACPHLREIVARTQARSVVWDAEEPWTQARRPLPYTEAAVRIKEGMRDTPMGVTGIGYTPANRFGPLAAVCGTLLPQCYATSTSGLSPATCVHSILKRWRPLFGADKVVVVGLAAYRQPAPGYTVESSLRTAFAGAQTYPDVSQVVYWSLGAIRQSAAVSRIVRALATGEGETARALPRTTKDDTPR